MRWLLSLPIGLFLTLALPRAARACSVCAGQSDSPLASATNMGICALLVGVVWVLCGFATFIVPLDRRATLAADGTIYSALEPGRLAASTPQEGTAQC